MSLLMSPKNLLKIGKELCLHSHKLTEQEKQWYFSPAGEKAYWEAQSWGERTIYYYEYLSAVAKAVRSERLSDRNLVKSLTKSDQPLLYKIASVMANAVDRSRLPYATYPDILDPQKNPLVRYVDSGGLCGVAVPESEHARRLFAMLHGDWSVEKNKNVPVVNYTNLTYCAKDGTIPDLYGVERMVIRVFDWNPYRYDVDSVFETIVKTNVKNKKGV